MLVRRYAGRAIGAACALLGNRDDATDASQEAFVRAWRGLKGFSGRSSFYTWYSALMRNVCFSRLRRRRRHQTAELTEELAARLSSAKSGPPDQCDPSVLAEQNEEALRLWQAIGRLSPAHREIIVLSHFQQMSYREIAEVLVVPIGTVMSRLHNARHALRTILSGDR